jgi:UDP-N-acetylmuramoylalanine--D-glutamate ligase
LIAGGMGKGADFSSLQDSVSSHCKRLILIGEAAQEMRVILENCTDTTLAGSLEQAVKLAGAEAIEGDCVLLSPACASFDMFSGYAARGDTFIQAVAQLAEESQ